MSGSIQTHMVRKVGNRDRKFRNIEKREKKSSPYGLL